LKVEILKVIYHMNGNIILKQDYYRLNKDENIKYISSCLEINCKNPEEILDKRDIKCEFDVFN